MYDDIKMTIFNAAGAFIQLMSIHGRPDFANYRNQHPVTQFLSKFLSENTLPPTSRVLTCAETIYIIERTLGRFFSWPKTFVECRAFLTNVHFHLYRIRLPQKYDICGRTVFFFLVAEESSTPLLSNCRSNAQQQNIWSLPLVTISCARQL